MQIFEFGPPQRVLNKRGNEVEVSDFKLHVQCRWRFVDSRSILFGRTDLAYPADPAISDEAFDYDKAKSLLDLKQRAWFAKMRPTLPKVLCVEGDRYGGLCVHLERDYRLELFSDASQTGEYSESWRFFDDRSDGRHFVITGYGVEGVDKPIDS